MGQFSNLNREVTYESLTEATFDVLIIGGGITGAGIALDASSRGLRTALVEMDDFAAATSSRSSKLTYRALQYANQMKRNMRAEIRRECQILLEIAPHLVKSQRMITPLYKADARKSLHPSKGLRVPRVLTRGSTNRNSEKMSAKGAIAEEPLLNRNQLLKARNTMEYMIDDARLTINVLKSAAHYGATVINYAKVVELIYQESGMVGGVMVEDQITGQPYQVFAKKVINATGPWLHELKELEGSSQNQSSPMAKGIHVVFGKDSFPLQTAVQCKQKDGKIVVAIPRGENVYIGTVVEFNDDDDLYNPTVLKQDVEMLLAALDDYFPSLTLTSEAIKSSWAGIIPVEAESRRNGIAGKEDISISESSLISVEGHTLIGYRKIAERVIDLVTKQMKQEARILYSKSETKHIPISGGELAGFKGFQAYKSNMLQEAQSLGMERTAAEELIDRYGRNVQNIFEIYRSVEEQALTAGINRLVFAELNYAIDYEWIYKPVDFFIRRTGALFFNIGWVVENQNTVIEYMSTTFDWKPEEKTYYRRELQQAIKEAVNKE